MWIIVGLDGSLGLRRRCSPTSRELQRPASSPARFVSPRCAVRANAEHARLPRATSRSNRSRGVPATMPFGLAIAEPGRNTITGARYNCGSCGCRYAGPDRGSRTQLNRRGSPGHSHPCTPHGRSLGRNRPAHQPGVTTVSVTVLTRATVAISTGEEARVIAALCTPHGRSLGRNRPAHQRGQVHLLARRHDPYLVLSLSIIG